MRLTMRNAPLDHIRQSPSDRGRLELIVVDHTAETDGALDVAHGLVGERRRSGDRQLTIMNARVIELLAGATDRWPVAGDQLFVDLDLSTTNLPAGTHLQIGSAIVEVTPPPHRGCEKFGARFGREALDLVNTSEGIELNLRGIHAKVVQGGAIRVGEAVRKLS